MEYKWRGSSLGWFVGLVRLVVSVPKIFILPGLRWSAQYNTIFLTVHYFNLCATIAQQPGQAVVQGRLSLICVSARTYGLGKSMTGLEDVLSVSEVRQLKFRQKKENSWKNMMGVTTDIYLYIFYPWKQGSCNNSVFRGHLSWKTKVLLNAGLKNLWYCKNGRVFF